MNGPGLVDWGLARRVARGIAGNGGGDGIEPGAAKAAGEEALERVLAYTDMRPLRPVPEVEVVTREEWARANLADLRDLAAPLEERAAGEISLPGPLGRFARGALGAAAGIEAGVVVGYASRRVLGQYQLSLGPDPGAPRLLLVGPNVAGAGREIEADPDGFLLWVAIHEQTHSVQFASVPWLRDHLAGLLARLIEGASAGVDFSALAALARRLVTSDPRRALREALRGELARALAGAGQAALIDEMQAVMAVVEGHAEHVMDAACADDPELAGMRERLDRRRRERSGFADLLARALGLGMKLRQYELGKKWADAVVAEAGPEALNLAWADPESLPSMAELEAPVEWIARVTAGSRARAQA